MKNLFCIENNIVYFDYDELKSITNKIKVQSINKKIYEGKIVPTYKFNTEINNGELIKLYIYKSDVWLLLGKSVYVNCKNVEFIEIEKHVKNFKETLKEIMNFEI